MTRQSEKWVALWEKDMALSVAFKEWAVVCRALAAGKQSLILRKGGIAEAGGHFRPEHSRFLLYPTHFHEQQRTGIQAEYLPLLEAAESEHRPDGMIRFSHYATVTEVVHLDALERALALGKYHAWTPEEVSKRFRYRSPGLYLFLVRVHRLENPMEIGEKPEFAGCKTWVELDQPVSIEGASPVLGDEAFADITADIRKALSRPG
jgi:hypothetical protein